MTYKEKLEELKKIAVEKFQNIFAIEADFISGKCTRSDLDKAINDHNSAVNDYGRLLHDMRSKGCSESHEIDG